MSRRLKLLPSLAGSGASWSSSIRQAVSSFPHDTHHGRRISGLRGAEKGLKSQTDFAVTVVRMIARDTFGLLSQGNRHEICTPLGGRRLIGFRAWHTILLRLTEFAALFPHLNERQRRLVAAADARAMGTWRHRAR